MKHGNAFKYLVNQTHLFNLTVHNDPLILNKAFKIISDELFILVKGDMVVSILNVPITQGHQ